MQDIWLGDMDGKAVCLKVLRTFGWSKCQEDECLKVLLNPLRIKCERAYHP